MKSLCTKGFLFFALALLVVGAAACTQSKPAVPTPTLVPLNNQPVLPAGQETATSPNGAQNPSENPTLIPLPSNLTPVAPSADATPVSPDGVVTPIVAEPTLLPTPTTVGDTSSPAVPTTQSSTTNPSSESSGSCSNPYTVQPGEWFYAIARKCGVTPQALVAANPGVNPNVLRPGQTLNIPGGGSTEPNAPPPAQDNSGSTPPSSESSGSCSNPYTVQPGDTLSSIGRKCGTTAAAIQAANNIPSPDYIFPGQQLQIP